MQSIDEIKSRLAKEGGKLVGYARVVTVHRGGNFVIPDLIRNPAMWHCAWIPDQVRDDEYS